MVRMVNGLGISSNKNKASSNTLQATRMTHGIAIKKLKVASRIEESHVRDVPKGPNRLQKLVQIVNSKPKSDGHSTGCLTYADDPRLLRRMDLLHHVVLPSARAEGRTVQMWRPGQRWMERAAHRCGTCARLRLLAP
jgi:hypothetical protein